MTCFSFSLDKDELKNLSEELTEHNKTCKFYDDGTGVESKTGAIGGRLTYEFTPTGLGVIAKVVCACGHNMDITDYDSW